jgi:hypothetical protein
MIHITKSSFYKVFGAVLLAYSRTAIKWSQELGLTGDQVHSPGGEPLAHACSLPITLAQS